MSFQPERERVVDIVRLSEVGDFVERDEEIATIETDKVSVGYSGPTLVIAVLHFTDRN